jgi:hypothetical protein
MPVVSLAVRVHGRADEEAVPSEPGALGALHCRAIPVPSLGRQVLVAEAPGQLGAIDGRTVRGLAV